MPVSVLMSESTSAPPASAARAISVISVTFGDSLTIKGCAALSFTRRVMCSTAFAWVPKAMPPSLTFGQEMLSSKKSTGDSRSRSTTSTYSSSLWPQTLTTTRVSNCFKKGKSRLRNTSTPGFCRPIAFSMPLGVSAMRGVGLPAHGTAATPLVTTAPSLFKSTNSLYSSPAPKVPLAVITGFLRVIPARLTSVEMFKAPPPLRETPVRRHRRACF